MTPSQLPGFIQKWKAYLAIVVAVLASVGITVAVTSGTDDNGHRAVTVVVHTPILGAKAPAPVPVATKVDTNDPGRAPDKTIVAPVAAVKQVAASDAGEHTDLRNEAPVGTPLSQIKDAQEKADQLAQTDQLPIVTPDAAPSERGCVSAFVKNYSSRRGVRPRLLVIHYTVSPNRPGTGDVNAVVNLFNTPAFQASSNYVIDREGNCKYIVRESDKAWTQAAANPFSISWEVINSGREPSLTSGPGLKKLGQELSDAGKRWDIPLSLGAVNGCTPTKAGIVSHQMLGICGGGHFDISPFPLAPIIKAAIDARGSAPKPVTAVDRRTCQKLNHFRADRRNHVKVSPHRIRINVNRRKALAKRHIVCTAAGPVRH